MTLQQEQLQHLLQSIKLDVVIRTENLKKQLFFNRTNST